MNSDNIKLSDIEYSDLFDLGFEPKHYRDVYHHPATVSITAIDGVTGTSKNVTLMLFGDDNMFWGTFKQIKSTQELKALVTSNAYITKIDDVNDDKYDLNWYVFDGDVKISNGLITELGY